MLQGWAGLRRPGDSLVKGKKKGSGLSVQRPEGDRSRKGRNRRRSSVVGLRRAQSSRRRSSMLEDVRDEAAGLNEVREVRAFSTV